MAAKTSFQVCQTEACATVGAAMLSASRRFSAAKRAIPNENAHRATDFPARTAGATAKPAAAPALEYAQISAESMSNVSRTPPMAKPQGRFLRGRCGVSLRSTWLVDDASHADGEV